jgi:hypothetical protein
MAIVYRWRIYCTTDARYEYTWSETEPTVCPIDAAHTIDANLTAIVEAQGADGPKSPDGAPIIRLDAPAEPDGKPVFVMSPSTEGWMTWFTGSGDDLSPTPPASGRGEGTKLEIDFAGPGTEEVAIQMLEPVEIHDGQLCWDPALWTKADRWSFKVRMPATVTTPNAGAGNCNLVDLGGYNLIVPAAGDGSHDIDLGQAVPVPSSTGYWDVDHDTGAVAPSTSSASWVLLDLQIESYFMRNMPLSNPLGIFDIDTYKAEWISERWKLVLEVVRSSAGSADVSGWLMFFREHST